MRAQHCWDEGVEDSTAQSAHCSEHIWTLRPFPSTGKWFKRSVQSARMHIAATYPSVLSHFCEQLLQLYHDIELAENNLQRLSNESMMGRSWDSPLAVLVDHSLKIHPLVVSTSRKSQQLSLYNVVKNLPFSNSWLKAKLYLRMHLLAKHFVF